MESSLTYCGVASMVPGTICLPIGLFLAGWTAQARTHWIAVDIVRLCLSLIFSHLNPHPNPFLS